MATYVWQNIKLCVAAREHSEQVARHRLVSSQHAMLDVRNGEVGPRDIVIEAFLGAAAHDAGQLLHHAL